MRYVAKPDTEMYVVNVVDLLGRWQAYHRETGTSVNGAIANLLDRVDWDQVDERALRLAFRIVLANVPAPEAAAVSAGADKERKILAEYVGDDARLPKRDQHLVRMLEKLRPNPSAFRAAIALIKALGKGPKPELARVT